MRTRLTSVRFAAATAAVAIAAAALAAASSAGAAPVTPVFPADWSHVVDDTRTITIAVPPTWNEVDTVPAQNSDGTPRPWISATPDQARFLPTDGAADTFAVPGVIYVAIPLTDEAAMLASSEHHRSCAAQPPQPVTAPTFTGQLQEFRSCGGTATRIVMVAAHPADNAFTAVLLVQLTGAPDDDAVLAGLLQAFGRYVEPGTT